ncbi:MAG TPA: hypothetical protein VGI06_14950 [Acidimicrobiales bacterium]
MRAAGVLAGAAVVAVLAGCGGQGPSALRGDPQTVVRAAADRTLAAGTARVDVTVAVDTAGTGLSGTGIADLAGGKARLALARTGSAAPRDDRFTVVVDGSTEYVDAAGGGGPMPGTSPGAPWLAGSPGRLAVDGRSRISPLDSLLVRPGAATDLAFLRGAVQVRPYGGQEIRGAGTYRYSIDVDLRQAIAASPPDQRPALEAANQAIGPVLWPVDVWLDAQGRVRHLEMAEDPEAHTTTTRGNIIIYKDTGNALPFTDLDFYDFGTPAKITVPSRDQAVEAT